MAEVKAIISNPGKSLLTQALIGYKLFRPSYFLVGNAVGFTPLVTDVAPNGATVFTGSRLLIQARQTGPDTARFVLTIPEGEGPFDIGNIMMFAENSEGNAVPFAYVVLPFVYRKVVSDPNLQSTVDSAVPIPGNRFVCNITIKHSVEATSMTVEVVTPTFSSLAFHEDISSVPPPSLNPWTTFVVHNDPRSLTPALLTKRDDDTYWGIPFWQNYRAPSFGTIDGGLVGDQYKATQEGYVWGHTYLTPDPEYSGALGGSGYATTDDEYTSNVGGLSY